MAPIDPTSPEASPIAWLAARLRPLQDAVAGSWIPSGFDAYARILHPVEERDGEAPRRWADVSRWSGVALTATSTWVGIALPESAPATQAPWASQGPREGSLSRADATALVSVLAPRSPGRCYFGLWEGYGGQLTVAATSSERPRRVSSSPVVALPWRSYELYEGPVAGATCFESTWFQSPNMWWSDDQSWCVASEIDLPWTYIAGSRDLVDALLANAHLEVLEASLEDPMWNRLPRWLEERIRAGTDDVLESGSTTMDFSLGTVSVTLERRSRRKSVMRTRSNRSYGSGGWAGSTTPLDTREPEDVRRNIRYCLEAAVLNLVQV